MSAKLKRSWSRSNSSVSPPAVKRQARRPPGDIENCHGQASSVRIFSWNVNGVNPLMQKRISFDAKAEYPLRSFLRRQQWPHFLCLQEVKISSKDEVTQRRLLHAANAGNLPMEPTYVIYYSLPRDKFNATGFGGKVHGVATLIKDNMSDKIISTRVPKWDLEGRALIHEMSNGVVVINGYWVNGTANSYRNPKSGVTEGTRHDYKLRFHQDMLDETLGLQKKGNHVVLVGDMNVACRRIDGHPNLRTSPDQHVKNRHDFNQKFFEDSKGLRAIDVFRQLHGEREKYTYHPRGCGWGESCDRVDLIIATRPLFESGAVRSTDICDNPEDRGHSDHVPLWIELDLTKISWPSTSKLGCITPAKQQESSPG